MTEKDLKKLNRKQVLELLLRQTERADLLEAKLEEAENKLCDRALAEAEAGSLAEASLRLNGVFEAAEAAASQYLENVKKFSGEGKALTENDGSCGETVKGTEKLCAERLAETEKLCAERLAETEKLCAERLAETEKLCAEKESVLNAKFKKLSGVLRTMYEEKKLLDSFFKNFNVEK